MTLERQWPGLLRKCKIMTDSPSYSFFGVFFPHALLFCHLSPSLCGAGFSLALGSSQALQQNVKSWCNHPLICLWMHFDRVLSYVVIWLRPFAIFVLPSNLAMTKRPFPYPFVLICCVIVLHCATVWACPNAHVFGHVLVSTSQVWTCECSWWCLCGSSQSHSRGND